jgi:hypothetical protein
MIGCRLLAFVLTVSNDMFVALKHGDWTMRRLPSFYRGIQLAFKAFGLLALRVRAT